MRVQLVVDATCDLPQSFIDENDILILPSSLRLESEIIQDFRDPENMCALYRSGRLNKAYDAESIPLSIDDVREIFLENVVCQYDFASARQRGTRTPAVPRRAGTHATAAEGRCQRPCGLRAGALRADCVRHRHR